MLFNKISTPSCRLGGILIMRIQVSGAAGGASTVPGPAAAAHPQPHGQAETPGRDQFSPGTCQRR